MNPKWTALIGSWCWVIKHTHSQVGALTGSCTNKLLAKTPISHTAVSHCQYFQKCEMWNLHQFSIHSFIRVYIKKRRKKNKPTKSISFSSLFSSFWHTWTESGQQGTCQVIILFVCLPRKPYDFISESGFTLRTQRQFITSDFASHPT